MRLCGLAVAIIAIVSPFTAVVRAIDLDVTLQDVESALVIARSRDLERARFHERYIQRVNTPFVETVEVVSEYRRVVLIAEERAVKGDRMFGYSAKLAQHAVAPWKQRVSIVARLRFHPLNNYVGVPDVDIVLLGPERARIGVKKEPVLSLPSSNTADRLPVLGAVVEAVFDAAALGNATHQFVIRLEKKDIGRVTFDLAPLQ